MKNVILGSLKAMLRDARRDGYQVAWPFGDLEWAETIDEDPDPFSEEERERLLDYFRRKEWKIGGFDDRCLHYPYYAYLATLFFTGCRPSELAALRVGDVDLQQGAIRIRRSRHLGVEAAPKTRSANRWVRLARTRVAILEPLIELRAEPGDYLFKNVHGDPIDQSNFAGLFRDAQRALGIHLRKLTRRNTLTFL